MQPTSLRDDPEAWERGQTEVAVDWCPNLDCPSNRVLRGLTRVGVSTYVCTACGTELSGPMSEIFDHRRIHQ